MDDIFYATPEEQIRKLKGQNLIIEDEAKAKRLLNTFGYFNLIKSYRDPYIIDIDGIKSYRSGVTFNQLYSLYTLDKNLRNAVMASMIDLEEYIKEAAADVLAKTYGTHPQCYLAFRNFANKRKRKHQFTLTGLLETMYNTLDTDKDPIHHYNTEHGTVPPWILFKSIYFSTIINFIDQFKTAQKNEMINKLYNLEDLLLSAESGRFLLMDTLFICLEYRNLAAHGGRTYNYHYNYSLREKEIWGTKYEKASFGFGQFLYLLSLLDYQAPYQHLKSALSRELNRHCNIYPQDVTYLGQILNMNIEPKKIVWISPNSNKYHTKAHCSGMNNAIKTPFDSAEIEGYIPCRRCT